MHLATALDRYPRSCMKDGRAEESQGHKTTTRRGLRSTYPRRACSNGPETLGSRVGPTHPRTCAATSSAPPDRSEGLRWRRLPLTPGDGIMLRD
jgi:hypothetical protein